MKEKTILPSFAESYRKAARDTTHHLNIDNLSYGSTFVPSKIAISMQHDNVVTPIVWDDVAEDEHIRTLHMNPYFPKFIFPVQKCDCFGASPPIIPILKHDSLDTSMLWTLIAILTRNEELWDLMTKVRLRQSNWHGWILTYISNECLFHINRRSKGSDPFKMTYMSTIEKLMGKVVSY